VITKYHYWKFDSALPKETCEYIIKFAKDKRQRKGKIGVKNKKKDIHKKRNSNIVWLTERWIYNLVLGYVATANKNAGWNHQINKAEGMQFTIYKKGQYYGWHFDAYPEAFKKNKDKQLNGKIRKLSMTVSLNDPKEYEGGDFEFRLFDLEGKPIVHKCTEIRPQGSIVVFPSFVHHRVTPVTKGERNSLVVWSVGDPYV
tara:strand:+ start:483 stop:1082 length:600 start_codon:yes stop_codon:yes gene_type:complete